ncbi:FAD-dependent thymidylate synthase [Patescibacteria group bacterium]|nr:FAD-dependent thymidylate synthase [Patescibacteria group bacterium]
MDQLPKRRIYALAGLKPEIVAVTFAKTSRSPKTFSEIAEEMTDSKSSEFHEKWVVGYGHSSVAEHAFLNIAIENVSRLSIEAVEGNRLASYTEKSSRYQIFDENAFYLPDKIAQSEMADYYLDSMRFLMRNYLDLQQRTLNYLKTKIQPEPDEPGKAYEARMKCMALDSVRFIMPVATLANVGMSVNARNLEYAIKKFLSHPLKEVQDIGAKIKEEAQRVVPTLVKYADRNEYLVETNKALAKLSKEKIPETTLDGDNLSLVQYQGDADDRLVAALLYKEATQSYAEILGKVINMNQEEKEGVIDQALSRLTRFDHPIRELEYVTYVFDCLWDQGAYYDLKRHRMCTMTAQPLTIEHRAIMPKMITDAHLENQFAESIQKAEEGFNRLKSQFPAEAQYFVLNAHKRRFLWQLNLRELYWVVNLRSRKNGNFSYRQFAQKMYEIVKARTPLVAKYLTADLDKSDY